MLPLIHLIIDTAGREPLVALTEGSTPLHRSVLPEARRLSEDLVPAIQALFSKAGLSLGDCGGAVVTTGPGSFTGVRAGLAALTGLAVPLGLPVHAVTRFQLFHRIAVNSGSVSDRGVLLLLDSGRRELFGMPVLLDAECPTAAGAAQIGSGDILARLQETGEAVIGDGVDQLAADSDGLPQWVTARQIPSPPEARVQALASLGMSGTAGDPGMIPLPVYLRPPDAVPASLPPVLRPQS